MDIKPGDTVKVNGSKGTYKIVRPDGLNGHTLEDQHGNEVYVPNHKITPVSVPTPKGVTDTSSIAAVGDAFVLHLIDGCFIGGSGPESKRELFVARYQAETGHVLNGQGRHMSWHQNEETYDYSMRVVFPVPVDKSIMPGTVHPVQHREGFYELCNTPFVFELLRLGFDLGHNGTRV